MYNMATQRGLRNQENAFTNVKSVNNSANIRQGGRAVLGEITNQSAANNPLQNHFTKKSKKCQGFTIYEDGVNNENSMAPSSSVGFRKLSGSTVISNGMEAACSSRMPLREVNEEEPAEPPVSDFWADKVAKLPTVTRSDLASYHHYRLDHSISSETTQEDENEECPMVLDTSINDEECSAVATTKDSWRVPPLYSLSNVLNSTEYTHDILQYLKESETKLLPKWNYMTKQPDITFMMRSILVDWLVEVGEEYKLCTETLYLAVNYIDRFLSYMSVQRAKLQLVGTACMFIAAKYEEIYPPDVTEFTYITDDTYNKKQVLRMEHLVLKVLGFDLTVPTSFYFVNQFSNLSKSSDEVLFLAQYLSELTLLDAERYLCYTPSIIGASAVALARHTCQVPAWTEEMVKITGYAVEEFQSCLVSLHQTFTDAPKSGQQAMREKYKQDKYLHVSELVPAPISS